MSTAEGKSKVLRCYIVKEGDLFVASCIDLTLAAQGSSVAEAKKNLHSQIVDYIKQAVNEHKEHAYELLNRKASFSEWLHYQFIKLKCDLRDKRNNGDDCKSIAFEEETSYA